jgi:DNA replication protein DnaC
VAATGMRVIESRITNRILHHAEVVVLNGESYRLRQAKGVVRPKS